MAKIPLAVQLYTLRDLTSKDFAGTLKQVAQIGYAGVELAGWGNLKSVGEVKKVLDDNNLKLAGSHIGIDGLEKDLNKVLDENQTLGNKNIVVPYMPDTRRKDAAGWKQVAASFNKLAAECRKRGFEFAYHNHSFEFEQFDGTSGFDILWANTDPQLVKAELDVFWIQHGGADPVAYIKKLGKRVHLLHLKDMAAGPDRKFAEVGSGILDFKSHRRGRAEGRHASGTLSSRIPAIPPRRCRQSRTAWRI